MKAKALPLVALAFGVLLIATVTLGCVGTPSHKATPTPTSTVTPTPTSKVLIVGTSADFPPFEYKLPNGTITGFDIALIKLIAHKIGYQKVVIRNMDFDSLIPALESGQIQVAIAGMTITKEREKVVNFSIPYWNASQAAVVKNGSGIVINSIHDLYGKVIGVEKGTTGEYFVKDHVGSNATIKVYPTFVAAVEALVSGEVQVVIVDSPVAKMFEEKYPVHIAHIFYTGEHYGIAVSKSETQLLKEINKALEQIMHSPTWKQLIKKYFGGS